MANATQTIAGDVQLAGDLGGNNNAASPALTNTAVTPGSYVVAKFTVDAKGRLTSAASSTAPEIMAIIPDAMTVDAYTALSPAEKEARGNTAKGIVVVDDTNLTVADGLLSLTPPDATTTSKGVVQIGEGLSVTGGVVSYGATDYATTNDYGLVKIGSGLVVSSGVVSLDTLPDATTISKGVVQIGTNIDVAGGVISVKTASAADLGVVQIGSGLTVTDGVVELGSLPNATTSTLGVVQIGDNIDVTAGTISVPVATTSSLGVVSVQSGGGLTVTGGVLAFDGTYTNASYSQKGIVQIQSGGGISVTNGVISIDTTAYATSGSKGVVQVGANIDVDAGVISIKTASDTEKGVVQIGSGLDVVDGVVSWTQPTYPDASTTEKGIVQITQANGLNISSGVLSFSPPDATTSTKGVVQIGDGLSVTGGEVSTDATVPRTTTVNNFTKTVYSTAYTLTDDANIAVDASQSNLFTVTLGGNRTLDNPTNLAAGEYTFIIKQDGVGGRQLAFGSAYKWKSGFSNILSTSAGAVDMIVAISDGTNVYCSLARGFV